MFIPRPGGYTGTVPTIVTALSLILASASPRRRELLEQIGLAFQCCPAAVDESWRQGEPVGECVKRLALQKARLTFDRYPDSVVLGSDTMVIVDNVPFGKPKDRRDGIRMIESLSGRCHEVMTGIAIISSRGEDVMIQTSVVTFRPLLHDEIVAYWETGEPRDKAGGYGIQGIAAQFIESIEGSYSGVMGLPLFETATLLHHHGIHPLFP